MEKKSIYGLYFYKYFSIFVVCSVFGSFYEQIYHLINYYVRTGVLDWSVRQSVIYGPFNFVYGVGGILMVILLVPKKENWMKVYAYGCLLGGAVEYLLSLFQEKVFGTVSWDYRTRLLNIDGRTTVPYMLFWGLLCLFAVYKVFPFITKMIEKIPYNVGIKFSYILLTFLVFDTIITLVALGRQEMRRNGVEPQTSIGRICDIVYTDEYLGNIYHNARKR